MVLGSGVAYIFLWNETRCILYSAVLLALTKAKQVLGSGMDFSHFKCRVEEEPKLGE